MLLKTEHQDSEEFMRPYKELKRSMQEDLAGFPSSIARHLAADPNIMNGARFLFPVRTWKHVLHYGMKRLGIWHEDFGRPSIMYSDGDNCIEHPPQDFDYSLLIPVIKKFGGWIDFNLCNFTTYGRNESGQLAIVQSAYSHGNMSWNEQKFVNAVFRAFGFS